MKLCEMPFLTAWLFCTIVSLNAWSQSPQDRLDPNVFGPGSLIGAMEELDLVRPPSAINAISLLLAHPNHEVARTAAWLLRRMNQATLGVNVTAALLNSSESDFLTKQSAALSLGELRQSEGVQILRAAFRRESECRLRAVLIKAMGELHRPGMASEISQALQDQTCQEVRQAAASISAQVPDLSLEQMIPALSDDAVWVRVWAVWSLGLRKADWPKGLNQLLRVLQNDPDCRVQAAAVWALSRFQDVAVEAALQAALKGSCSRTRQAAAWALTRRQF